MKRTEIEYALDKLLTIIFFPKRVAWDWKIKRKIVFLGMTLRKRKLVYNSDCGLIGTTISFKDAVREDIIIEGDVVYNKPNLRLNLLDNEYFIIHLNSDEEAEALKEKIEAAYGKSKFIRRDGTLIGVCI